MLNVKSFLAVDFGAGSLKLAEFEVNEAGGLRLKQYAIKALGAEGAAEATRNAVLQKALQDLLASKGIKTKSLNVCAPGFHVFSKFVKLPPVDPGKVTQMIQYEAQQNVPFPLTEVVWDYQILGTTQSGELEVLLVAIKSEIVEGLFALAEKNGLRLQVADVSPAALCNSFRYNYGELEDCTMLLDIGAKTSNLLFFEKGKVYSRSIALGANSITQDFANESKLKFEAAEKLKIEEGFVSLGGAYEEPENQHQAAISKIARQFMTRLHIQVNQTMQFWRGQQGGSAPQRVYLSGGASIMPYTAQFFAEKLNIPVEYFNPLRNVQLDPSINLEDLARVAHSLGEVVGLGLRNLAHCPVELNLIPASTLKLQQFNEKKPYLLATVYSMAAVVWALGFFYNQLASGKDRTYQELHGKVEPEQLKKQSFEKALGELKTTKAKVGTIAGWAEARYYWLDVIKELREVLERVESATKTSLNADSGIWIESLITAPPQGDQSAAAAAFSQPSATASSEAAHEAMMRRYGLRGAGMGRSTAPAAAGGAPPADPSQAGRKTGGTNDAGSIDITFRSISLAYVQPDANKSVAFAVLAELKANPLFDATNTVFSSLISAEEAPGTFSFKISAQLKRPLKL